jgi:hypothetical protein
VQAAAIDFAPRHITLPHLQYNLPLRSSVSDARPKYDQRNRKKHDGNVDPSLRPKGIDVAGLGDPWQDAVEEAEGEDVLDQIS